MKTRQINSPVQAIRLEKKTMGKWPPLHFFGFVVVFDINYSDFLDIYTQTETFFYLKTGLFSI